MAERYGDLSDEQVKAFAAGCKINRIAMALGRPSCVAECKLTIEDPPACPQANSDQVFSKGGKGILFPPNHFVQENLHNTEEPVKAPPEEKVAENPEWEYPI